MTLSLKGIYESVLLGNRTFPASIIRKMTESDALALYRYVFSDLLGWSPEKMHTSITMDILEFLRLDVFLQKITCPAELIPEVDLFYIAEAMYPSKFRVYTEQRVLRTYEQVLNGTLDKFPKNFFATPEATDFACTCLRKAISDYIDVQSTEDLYKMFSNNAAANEFLKQCNLFRICVTLYDGKPLNFLHDAMPETLKDESLYRFMMFINAWNKSYGKKVGKYKDLSTTNAVMDFDIKVFDMPPFEKLSTSCQPIFRNFIEDLSTLERSAY